MSSKDILYKTKNERLEEILSVRKDLHGLGYRNTHEEVDKLFNCLSDFVQGGFYCNKKFTIHGYEKIIYVELFPTKNKDNNILIKHVKNV
jgi:hypothetical protein